jgi:outer membrane protein assembly factor BamB
LVEAREHEKQTNQHPPNL